MSEIYKKGSSTCILIGRGNGNVNAIPLQKSGLDIQSYSEKEFREWSLVDYPVKEAARRYLNFARIHGATNQVLRLLREIIQSEGQITEEPKMAKKKDAPEVKTKVLVETGAAVKAAKPAKAVKAAKKTATNNDYAIKLVDIDKLKGDILVEIGTWIKKRKNPPSRQQILDTFVEKGHPKVSVACCLTAGIRSGGLAAA